MNKVYKALKSEFLGEDKSYGCIKPEYWFGNPEDQLPGVKNYKINCKFSVEVSCGAGENKIDEQAALRRAWRLICEDVFGEFRPMLTEAYKRLHAKDFEAAYKAIVEIEDRMFKLP